MAEQEEVTSFEQWMSDRVKAERQLERRVQALNLEDQLGAGIDVLAHQVVDWNSDEALTNGFFWSDTTAINAPDSGVIWYGTVTATEQGGVQRVSGLVAAAPQEWHRYFTIEGGGVTPSFTAWEQLGGGSAPFGGYGGDVGVSGEQMMFYATAVGDTTMESPSFPGLWGGRLGRGHSIDPKFELDVNHAYDVWAHLYKGPDAGWLVASIDFWNPHPQAFYAANWNGTTNVVVVNVDCYSPTPSSSLQLLGSIRTPDPSVGSLQWPLAGMATLNSDFYNKNPSSSGYDVGIFGLALLKTPSNGP